MVNKTAIIAAINLNRKYVGIELSENYVNLANQRISENTVQTKLKIL